jgi:hypothetical protein
MLTEILILATVMAVCWNVGQIIAYVAIQKYEAYRSRQWYKEHAAEIKAHKQACSDVVAMIEW